MRLIFLLSVSAALSFADPPHAKYGCGVFLSGKYTFTQTVTLKPDGTYETSTGSSGKYKYDDAAKRIDFAGGALQSSFGKYEPENHQIFRLTSKEDADKSTSRQNWRSQICTPRK